MDKDHRHLYERIIAAQDKSINELRIERDKWITAFDALQKANCGLFQKPDEPVYLELLGAFHCAVAEVCFLRKTNQNEFDVANEFFKESKSGVDLCQKVVTQKFKDLGVKE